MAVDWMRCWSRWLGCGLPVTFWNQVERRRGKEDEDGEGREGGREGGGVEVEREVEAAEVDWLSIGGGGVIRPQ